MKTAFLSFVGSIVLFSTVATVAASAQSWPAGITPVRGVVTSVSGDALTLNSQTGPVKIHLGNRLKVYKRTPSDLAHVNSESFVGVTSVKTAGRFGARDQHQHLPPINVPRDVSETALTPTTDKLKPGENVFVLAKTQRDGSFSTTSIVLIGP